MRECSPQPWAPQSLLAQALVPRRLSPPPLGSPGPSGIELDILKCFKTKSPRLRLPSVRTDPFFVVGLRSQQVDMLRLAHQSEKHQILATLFASPLVCCSELRELLKFLPSVCIITAETMSVLRMVADHIHDFVLAFALGSACWLPSQT